MLETSLNSIKKQRVLLSPLNWGLGHVTRTIPIIEYLLKNENEIIICCNSDQENLYRHYFPQLWYIPHGGYPFNFRGKGNWTGDILRNIFMLSSFVRKENRIVNDLVEKFNPDIILSDQRFGFRSEKVKSIVISHQLNLPVADWNFIAKGLNIRFLRRFDEIWIPDCRLNGLSGKMSKTRFLKNIRFIGSCSRFGYDSIEKFIPHKIKFAYLGIVTGPPPYSEEFLCSLMDKFSQVNKPCAIIAPFAKSEVQLEKNSNVYYFQSPGHKEFLALLLESKVVISRAGYTTLMDLTETENEAILIPTRGQREQEYLSRLHKNHENWRFVSDQAFKNLSLT